MKNICIILSLLFISGQALLAQKYFTREGKITFTSEAPLEKIEAKNEKATSVIDIASGKMEFAVLIKAFQFEKALMQEHFNENYMESSTYPKATFKGKIKDTAAVDFSSDGTYDVVVTGNITIHGVTRDIEAPGTIAIENGDISASSTFELTVADFDIKIPAVVRENIAKTVTVMVDLNYELLKS